MRAVCYFIKSRAYLVFWYRVIFNLLHEIAHFHNVVIHIQINILQKHINEFKFVAQPCQLSIVSANVKVISCLILSYSPVTEMLNNINHIIK